MAHNNVIEHIDSLGQTLLTEFKTLVMNTGLEQVIDIQGYPCWTGLVFQGVGQYQPLTIKTFIMQELIELGFLSIGTHNLCAAHTQEDMQALIKAYELTFEKLANHIKAQSLQEMIRGKSLTPVFKVRA